MLPRRQGRRAHLLRRAGRRDPRHRAPRPRRAAVRPGDGRADARTSISSSAPANGTRSACAAPAATASRSSGEAPLSRSSPSDFAEIAAQSMLATAHLLWSAVWYGIATDALAPRAGLRAHRGAQAPDGPPPGALRLAEAVDQAAADARQYRRRAEALRAARKREPDDLNSMGFAVAMNNIKIGSSELAIEIINHALLITGIAGYKNDTPYSVGRHLRDALSAPRHDLQRPHPRQHVERCCSRSASTRAWETDHVRGLSTAFSTAVRQGRPASRPASMASMAAAPPSRRSSTASIG